MARGRSRREMLLIAGFGLAAAVWLWRVVGYRRPAGRHGRRQERARRRRSSRSRKAPLVHMELLDRAVVKYEQGGRDLFKYSVRPRRGRRSSRCARPRPPRRRRNARRKSRSRLAGAPAAEGRGGARRNTWPRIRRRRRLHSLPRFTFRVPGVRRAADRPHRGLRRERCDLRRHDGGDRRRKSSASTRSSTSPW